jgi:hypothetical protein
MSEYSLQNSVFEYFSLLFFPQDRGKERNRYLCVCVRVFKECETNFVTNTFFCSQYVVI